MTDPAALALLERIAAAVEALRADLRRQRTGAAERAFARALAEHFAASPAITTAALLAIADADPHSAIADSLAELLDLAAPGRAVALGRLLARLPGLELVGSLRGAALYRARED